MPQTDSQPPYPDSVRLMQRFEKQAGITSQREGFTRLGWHHTTYRLARDGHKPLSLADRLALAAVVAGLPAFGDRKPVKVVAKRPGWRWGDGKRQRKETK